MVPDCTAAPTLKKMPCWRSGRFELEFAAMTTRQLREFEFRQLKKIHLRRLSELIFLLNILGWEPASTV